MRIALGADHRGDAAVATLAGQLRTQGHHAEVLGSCHGQPCDYPDQAWIVGNAVADGRFERGILICGTGIGVCIAANKIKGVRAALVYDELAAAISRSHNDANIICLSADMTPLPLIYKIVKAWLTTPFEGGRHERRVKKIEAIERGEEPSRALLVDADGPSSAVFPL